MQVQAIQQKFYLLSNSSELSLLEVKQSISTSHAQSRWVEEIFSWKDRKNSDED